jgi:regulatory protein
VNDWVDEWTKRKSAKPRDLPERSRPLRLRRQDAGPGHALGGRSAAADADRVEPGERGEAAIAAAMARLREHGYLDDAAFAETYARLRQENEKLGVRSVRQDLQQKGIGSELIAETLEARYAQTNEEALAREHLERKRMRKPENEKETARMMRRLVAAGISTGVIYKILRQWDVPDEALAALDNLADELHDE